MKRLSTRHYKVLKRVSCQCSDGVLVLRGHLFPFHEKQLAQETVAEIKGVTSVVNEIEVS